ncbi:MAG: amidohydrolase family protein, partial [Salinivirgaceae bacterium]|nr:amidohydrolase family protein [Salinivirgaceae bacterium]
MQAILQSEKTLYNAVIITMNPELKVIRNGYVTISGNTITEIGEGIPKNGKNMVDIQGDIIIPGFVNAHTHLPMTLYRGLADDLPLKTWLEDHIWPAEATHTHEENVRKGARLGLAEMIQTGTTTFCDMYFFADAVAEETAKSGMRAVMNEAILDFPTNSYPHVEAALDKAEQFIGKWKSHPLIHPGLIFHATYSCS